MSNQDQYQITASLDGIPLGEFDTKSGGATGAPNINKRRPGAMLPQKVYRSQSETTDVVIGRVLERERDWDLVRLARLRQGSGVLTVHEQPLDDLGAPWGRPVIYSGILSNVEPNDVDANGTGLREFTLTAVVGNPT